MTICISAKITKADGTIVTRTASDSEVSFGNKVLLGISESCEKVIQFNGASVAASGSGCVFEALDILKSDQRFAEAVQFKTRADIRAFAIDFYAEVDSLIEQAKIPRDDVSIGALLITTKDTVWGAFQDLSIFKFDRYFCSGSGADTAMGLMLSAYKRLGANPTEEDLENMLTQVIEETCELEQGCNPPVKIYGVLAPNPPQTKRSRKKKVLTEPSSDGKLNQTEEGVSKRDHKRKS